MPRVETAHPGLYELLEWVTGRPEVFDPARAREHLESGCPVCREEVRFLEALGEFLREESRYDSFFEGAVPPVRAEGEEDSLAAAYLAAMEEGPEALLAALEGGIGSATRRLALRHAVQRAARLVPKDPARAREVARIVVRAAREARDEALGAEAALLESQALTALGRTEEARLAVTRARSALGPDDAFRTALCDYFEGSAASFQGECAAAETLLSRAADAFAEYGQEAWQGRAVAALATATAQRGDDRAAQPLFDVALAALDPVTEANAYVQTLINKASSLIRLSEEGEAKRLYARALAATRRLGTSHQTHMIRVGLAEIEFRRGEFTQALASWRKLALAAAQAGYEEDVLLARLYEAETLGRLGREDEMREAVRRLRVERAGVEGIAPLEDLFACLDSGDLQAGAVTWVREHLERPGNVVYVPFRRHA